MFIWMLLSHPTHADFGNRMYILDCVYIPTVGALSLCRGIDAIGEVVDFIFTDHFLRPHNSEEYVQKDIA